MADSKTRLYGLLYKHGAKKLRDKNHNIYRLPNGKQLVFPKTPSDNRAYDNAISQLRNLLDLPRPEKVEGERRERKLKVKKAFRPSYEQTYKPTDPKQQEAGLDFGLRLALAASKLQVEIEKDLNGKGYKPQRNPRVEPTSRHGVVKQIPADIIHKANVIGKLHGEEARQNYLTMYMEVDRIPEKLRRWDGESLEDEENGDVTVDLRKMIEDTKKQRGLLDAQNEQSQATITREQTAIATRNDLKAKADKFIEQLEGTLTSYAEVEPMFVANRVKPEHTSTKHKGTRGVSRDGVPTVGKIIGVLTTIMQPKALYNAKTLLPLVQATPGFEGVDNRALHTALGYGSKKNNPPYVRDAENKGYYKLIEEAATTAA